MNPLFRPDEDALGGLLAGMTPQEAGNLAGPGLNAVGGLLAGLARQAPGSLGRAWQGSDIRRMAQDALDKASYYAGPHLSNRAAALASVVPMAMPQFGTQDARAAGQALQEGQYGRGAGLMGLGVAGGLLDALPGEAAVKGLLRGITKAAHYTPDLSMVAFHGSPHTALTELQPSTRGPLGPGVYLSPAEQVAQRYAGEGGKVYQTDIPDTSLFHGIKSRDSSVNPYQVWRDQSARLVEAAPSEHKAAVAELAGRMDPSDGYPFFARLSQLMGGKDKAQELLKIAGFKGMTGTVDGPELVHFGPLSLQQ
jgi:hypothetical protein